MLARAVGVPAALAFHVGDLRMRHPDDAGRALAHHRRPARPRSWSGTAGSWPAWPPPTAKAAVSANVTLADPEPLDPIPSGFWLRPQPFSIHAVWHLMNRHGRMKYRLDKARGGSPGRSSRRGLVICD